MTEREEGRASGPRFIAVSNRLPVVLERKEGHWESRPGSGGLVTAMAPVLRNRGGVWIGWPGTTGGVKGLSNALAEASLEAGYDLLPVFLSSDEVELFYHQFANSALWPLFHDLTSRASYSGRAWESYELVNRRYAEVIVESSRPDDYIWVHDYHLMLVGRELRALASPNRTGYFHHVPFPPLDIFLQLPWRSQMLGALLEFDLIGFQSLRDRRNFLHCVRRLIPHVRTRGTGSVISLTHGEREVRVGTFPISIDYEEFARQAADWPVTEAATWLRKALGGRTIILGVDRLDYTKGIPQRLEAIRTALTVHPELRGSLIYIQVAVPSREHVPEYQLLKNEIDRLVGEINGEFSEMDYVPIHYLYRSLSRDQLLTYYRAANAALLTPLKDGMNLVAKEYCAANVDETGVLILSDFAGATSQLHRWALTVNPHDAEGVSEAIYRACSMPQSEKRYRMHRLRQSIRRNDIFRWVDSFLEAAVAKHLDDFPLHEEYVPAFADDPPPARDEG